MPFRSSRPLRPSRPARPVLRPDSRATALPPVLPAPPHLTPTRVPTATVRAGVRPPLAVRSVAALAAAVGLLHVAANVWSPYGVHRDELLYLAMGAHLRLWAMDFPPGIAVLAQITRLFSGDRVADSLTVLRAGPALAAAALVVLAAQLARELGGRRGAQLLAAGTVGASPLFLRAGSLFQPVVLDQLWWTLGMLALVRLGRADEQAAEQTPLARTTRSTPRDVTPAQHRRGGRARWRLVWPPRRWQDVYARPWLLLGIAVGLGLFTKFSIAIFAAGALAGVLATPLRHRRRTVAPWVAAVVALALGAPSGVGQARLGWPVAGQLADLQASQLARVGPVEFVTGQLLLGPAVVLAGLGLAALLLGPRRIAVPATLARGRAAGVAALVAVGLLLVLHGKPYYAGPVYPLLWAAGAVAVAGWRRAPRRGWLGARARLIAAAALIGVYGLVTLPFGVPVLPPAAMARYAAALGAGTETNTGGRLALPQDYADMLGWPELTAAVASAWNTLSDAQRADAALLAANYGQAGALELYGPRLGLPQVVSAAGSWWFFGPGDRVGDPIVTVGVPDATLAPLCGAVRPLAVVRHDRTRWLVPEQQNVPVTLCEQPRRTLRELWPSLAGRH